MAATAAASDYEELRQTLDSVVEQNRSLQEEVETLRDEVRSARDEAADARAVAERAPVSAGTATGTGGLRLLDLSFDFISAAGFSSVEDEFIDSLQGGGHDPRRRGFNLGQLEISALGAVDPYFDAEMHLIYFLDTEGESGFELEEAFGTTRMLPFALEEHGLEIEFGQMFTEFGRTNPIHPHAWTWLDQPIVLSRFFGGDGMRGTGVRAGWLLPLPWTSEFHLGAQNAQGETMVSFLANDEVFEERPIGGRPFAERGNRSLADLVYLARWTNSFDLSPTWTGQIGISGLAGPNSTGSDANTWIYGADFVLKWMPLVSDRGYPFVEIEAEWIGRRYEADSFFGCAEEEDCDDPVALGSTTLNDWGAYAQMLWGFHRSWATGLRLEMAQGSGDSVGLYAARSEDPFRDDRMRISPLLQWAPSEYSRLRLQYNYDRADFLSDNDSHTLWLGLELILGSHPAHRF
ncbi:MAG: hypothetical protein GY937_18960 [bacterium]|nr:hypothetical protein [bacterium]